MIKDRGMKIQRALFITGSPIVWSAISTIGGSAFLFACRTWLLTELGILICTVIFLSLVFAMGFLLALLGEFGPLPIASSDGKSNIHTCDLMNIFMLSCFKKCSRKDDREERLTSEVEEDQPEQPVTSPSESGSDQGLASPSEETVETYEQSDSSPPVAEPAENASLEGDYSQHLRLVSKSWYTENSAEC